MLAGGKSVGPYATDRGTMKSHCENKSDDGTLHCKAEYQYTAWGETNCDTTCAPFGGTYNAEEMSCSFNEGADPVAKCNAAWVRTAADGTKSCDTYCLATGGEWYYDTKH